MWHMHKDAQRWRLIWPKYGCFPSPDIDTHKWGRMDGDLQEQRLGASTRPHKPDTCLGYCTCSAVRRWKWALGKGCYSQRLWGCQATENTKDRNRNELTLCFLNMWKKHLCNLVSNWPNANYKPQDTRCLVDMYQIHPVQQKTFSLKITWVMIAAKFIKTL